MVVTMSFTHAQTPAGRAAMDEARLRARSERLGANPGPGAYDARRVADNLGQQRPSSAFKSRVKRGESPGKQGDPGLYNPFTTSDLAATTNKSFNKTQQGSGAFGTRAKRADNLVIPDNPGPGTYDSKTPARPEAKQSSAFASVTKRAHSTPTEVTPGVGAYKPSEQAPRTRGGDSMFRSKDLRFKHDETVSASGEAVGPGTYTQEDHTITRKTASNSGKISSAFASNTLRDASWLH